MTQSIVDQFTDWVGRQEPSAGYDYFDYCGCAMFRFLSESGYPVRGVGGDFWRDLRGDEHPIPAPIRRALQGGIAPCTFGALHARLTDNGGVS